MTVQPSNMCNDHKALRVRRTPPSPQSFVFSVSRSFHALRAGEGIIVVWLVTWPYGAEEHGGSGGGEVWRGYRWGSSGGNRVGQATVEWSNPTWHHSAPNSVCIPLRVLLIPPTLLLNSLWNFPAWDHCFVSPICPTFLYIYIYNLTTMRENHLQSESCTFTQRAKLLRWKL